MKKYFLFLLFALFILVGCVKQNKLPLIYLEDNEITIDINESFDLMSGVSAFDYKNANLTEEIKIETDFNNLYEGNYLVTYSVTDKHGLENKVTRIINVVDKLRNMKAPLISNPNEIVISFNDYKLTNEKLYQRLKETVGLQTLIDLIDYELFKDYEIDVTGFTNYFEQILNHYDEKELDILLARMGYYQVETETDTEFYQRVKAYLGINFQKISAVKKATMLELTDNEVTHAKNNYKEDICVINLFFNTKTEVNLALTNINNTNVDAYFKTNNKDNSSKISDSYLSKQLECNYQRVIYNEQTSANYRDKVFALNIGEYTTEPIIGNNGYYLTYVINKALPKEEYTESLFVEAIKENLVKQKLTNDYVNNKVNALRIEKGLKIYDPFLAAKYQAIDKNFSGVSETSETNVLASYNGINLTPDDFYDILKKRYAASEILDDINYLGLKEITQIKLTPDDLLLVEKQISTIKSQYEYYYSYQINYIDFLVVNFGVVNESELANVLKTNILAERYILGYNDYTGNEPITKVDIDSRFDEYFNVKASHILFTYNDELSKELAYKKAYQLLNGVGDADAYIKFNGQNFVGLNNLSDNERLTYFSLLAEIYSEDPGSKVRKGDLGYYKPGVMVESFENETRKLAKTGIGALSSSPVESEFGYHVIIITDVKTPEKPSYYDDLSSAEIAEIIKNKSDEAVINYCQVIEELKVSLKAERLAYSNIEKNLSQLRNSIEIEILSDSILLHYQKLNELYLK